MSQKSSLPQPTQSVSWVLTADIGVDEGLLVDAGLRLAFTIRTIQPTRPRKTAIRVLLEGRRLMALLPLKLTETQLEQVMRTAGPIPRELRDEYLRMIAQALSGRAFGDGDVYRACAAAAKAVMWDMTKEAS
jgi:hypothetical protein